LVEAVEVDSMEGLPLTDVSSTLPPPLARVLMTSTDASDLRPVRRSGRVNCVGQLESIDPELDMDSDWSSVSSSIKHA